MNILLVNDDGVRAEGIHKLAKALSEVADIYVCAPSTQRSSTGHGISIGKPLNTLEVNFEGAKRAWQCDGLPVDCTRMGIHMMEEIGLKPHMIFSGINHGGNMGHDILYSGTVAAAAEGSLCGIQSVAVSVDDDKAIHFDMAAKLALRTAMECYGKVPIDTIISINTPNLEEREIKGVKVVNIGERKYTDHYEIIDGRYYLMGELLSYKGEDKNCDVALCEEGYAVITPLHLDLTNYNQIKNIEEIFK